MGDHSKEEPECTSLYDVVDMTYLFTWIGVLVEIAGVRGKLERELRSLKTILSCNPRRCGDKERSEPRRSSRRIDGTALQECVGNHRVRT